MKRLLFLCALLLMTIGSFLFLYVQQYNYTGVRVDGKRAITNALMEGALLKKVFQNNVSIEITAKLEFDGTAYEISPVVRCMENLKFPGTYYPEFSSYGFEMHTGQVLILLTPPVCSRKMINKLSEAKKEHLATQSFVTQQEYNAPLSYITPPNYIPTFAVANKKTSPEFVEIYTTKKAYENDANGLKFISMHVQKIWDTHENRQRTVDAAMLSNYLTADKVKYSETKPTKEQWLGRNYLLLSGSMWRNKILNKSEDLQEIDKLNIPSVLDPRICREIVFPTELYGQDNNGYRMRSAEKGLGVVPGQNIWGEWHHYSTKSGMLERHLLPFKISEGRWKPATENTGKYIIYNPKLYTNTEDTDGNNISHVSDNVEFHEGAFRDTNAFSASISIGKRCVYFPESQNIYVRFKMRFFMNE